MSNTSEMLTRNVFLIGFMGAGKSSVARKIARSCGVMALDMDKYIERSNSTTISEIFAAKGESAFRAIETETLREIADGPDALIVSCGGGAPLRDENRQIMHAGGYVIHLRVDADEAANRISDKSSRPLFNDIESARALCDSRMPVYDQAADITIETSDKSVAAIAGEVIRHLREKGILCQQLES